MSYNKLIKSFTVITDRQEILDFVGYVTYRNSEKITEMYYPALFEILEGEEEEAVMAERAR
jgi:hypothetical protein